MNLIRLMERIPDEAAAYEYLEGLRWNGKLEAALREQTDVR
jgi:hypothetical protein